MTRFPVMQLWCNTDSCLVISFFRVDRLSCKSNIVLWFTHTQSASSLCLQWAPRGRPTRWPSHTFLSFKSCTFIPPCSDPQCLIWFDLWILNWPPNWALHKMDQFKASLNTAASGSLPTSRCVQSSHTSFSSFTFYFYPCLQMHKIGRRSIQIRLASPPLHLLITVNPSSFPPSPVFASCNPPLKN